MCLNERTSRHRKYRILLLSYETSRYLEIVIKYAKEKHIFIKYVYENYILYKFYYNICNLILGDEKRLFLRNILEKLYLNIITFSPIFSTNQILAPSTFFEPTTTAISTSGIYFD